jgi:hypothetical protein
MVRKYREKSRFFRMKKWDFQHSTVFSTICGEKSAHNALVFSSFHNGRKKSVKTGII